MVALRGKFLLLQDVNNHKYLNKAKQDNFLIPQHHGLPACLLEDALDGSFNS